MKPRITVCVATYQFGPFLDCCIESLVTQTLQPTRIIVCDDCSTDDSWAFLQAWKNKFPDLIAICHPSKRLGPNEIGSFMCSHIDKEGGDFIVTIDGDDYWHKKKLELEYSAILNSPGAEYAFSDVVLTNIEDDEIGYWSKLKGIPSDGDIFPNVIGRRYFEGTNSIFRNELVSWRVHSEEGDVDRNLTNFWDWDRKIRFASKYKGVHSGEALVYYRQHPGGISKTFGQKNLFKAMIQVYEKHLPSLNSISLFDQLYVQISFEILAARQRKQLGITGYRDYNFLNVYKRIMIKFSDLLKADQSKLNIIFSSELTELKQWENNLNKETE